MTTATGRARAADQWRHFEKQFGSDGTDGLLKYPVYEGWGNHDGPPIGKEKFGFSTQAQLKARNAERKKAGRIGTVAENGLHYSWDWNKVHFVHTNLYPADKQHAKVRYSLPWHDPQGALAFVKYDLKAAVGDSGRPVVIMSHCGVDTDWWHPEDWADFYKAVKPYNVIAYFYGHSGTGLKKWKPEGEEKPLDCVNTGQTEKGFLRSVHGLRATILANQYDWCNSLPQRHLARHVFLPLVRGANNISPAIQAVSSVLSRIQAHSSQTAN